MDIAIVITGPRAVKRMAEGPATHRRRIKRVTRSAGPRVSNPTTGLAGHGVVAVIPGPKNGVPLNNIVNGRFRHPTGIITKFIRVPARTIRSGIVRSYSRIPCRCLSADTAQPD